MSSYQAMSFEYKSILNVKSFNTNSINKYVWNIRNNMRYLFFFILKKNILLKMLFLYKMLINFLNISFFSYSIKYRSFCLSHLLNLIYVKLINIYTNNFAFTNTLCYLTTQKQDYVLSFFTNDFFYISNINFVLNSRIKEINTFFILYKKYVYFIYLWLYSIKYLYFYKSNASSIPSQKSLYTVLRSPHKDKKAREQFKISRIKKAFLYPSFLNSNTNNLLFKNNVNETILIKHLVNKRK